MSQATDRDVIAILCILWACRRDIPIKARTFSADGLQWIKDHCQAGGFWVVRSPSPQPDDDDELAGFALVTPPTEIAGMRTDHYELF